MKFDFMEFFKAIEPKPIPGYVYAVQFEDGLIKIGSTSKPKERFYMLQLKYRGKPVKINKIYLSSLVDDSRWAEKRAQNGLKPVEKKETYAISFGEACRHIKKATGTRSSVITLSRRQTEETYPILIPTWERQERLIGKIIELANHCSTL